MLEYGFFDSEIIGYDEEDMPIFDRAESSDFLAAFISQIISDGILALPSDCFQVVAGEGMNLIVKPGFAIIRGRFARDKRNYEITIPNAPKAYKRIDRVIIRANYLERLCEIIVREGISGADPVPPELLQPASGDYYELCLATVMVSAGQTAITQSSITDTRYDSRVCGIVTQVIDHIDTSVFYSQLQQFYKEYVDKAESEYLAFTNGAVAEFQSWFNSVKDLITSVENGKLLAEINRLLNDMYRIATADDIDSIINDKYVDEEDEGGIFEAGTDQDIDDIIAGTYTDAEDTGENTDAGTLQVMTDIVDNTFK